jgi:hypothetical protein
MQRSNIFPPILQVTGISLALMSISVACDTLPFAQKTQSPVKILQYSQNCGSLPCARFQLSVFSDGTLRYEGEAYTPLMGLHARKLAEPEWQYLRQTIESANIWASAESYPAPDPNYAIPEISVFDQQFTKRVIGQQFPPEIQALESLLLQLSDPTRPDWKSEQAFSYEIPSGKYNSLFKVRLQPNVNVDYWLAKYYEVGMDRVKSVPDASNTWLMRFDPSRIPPNQLKLNLENDSDVMGVEYVDKPKVQN